MSIGNMAVPRRLNMFTETAEAQEGINAFNEKRQPDFRAHQA